MMTAVIHPETGEIVSLVLDGTGTGSSDLYLLIGEHEDNDKEDILSAIRQSGDPHPVWDYPYRDTGKTFETETIGVVDLVVDLDAFDDDYLNRVNTSGLKTEKKMRKDIRLIDKDGVMVHEGADAKIIRDARIAEERPRPRKDRGSKRIKVQGGRP